MKKSLLIIIATLPLLVFAQTEPKIPFVEIFSSSTCPPCKPASDAYKPILQHFDGEIAVVKYPMSWPGAGDPYFTDEGGERRTFYGVSGVPDMYANATSISYTAFDVAYVQGLQDEKTDMKLSAKFYIDENKQEVSFAIDGEVLEDYTTGDYKLFVSINETETFDNATTNGETDFHHIMKKLMPNEGGVIGESLGTTLDAGHKFSYDDDYKFEGDYRLPNGANDQIDHATEHSVEEFSDLEVMAWVQDMTTKDIIQAAVGIEVSSKGQLGGGGGGGGGSTGDPTDPATWPIGIDEVQTTNISLFPNPVKDELNIRVAGIDNFKVEISDLLGKTVYTNNFNGTNNVISVETLSEGIYMVKVVYASGSYLERVVVK